MVRPRHPKKKAGSGSDHFGRNPDILSISAKGAGWVTEVGGRLAQRGVLMDVTR